jgi:hypothetical protein
VQKCLDNGTIVLLTTPPPQTSGDDPKEYGDSAKVVAAQKGVPIIDYWTEIKNRRPDPTWELTLISADGTHPTWVDNDWSANGLKNSGYGLRNYITLKKYEEVYNKVLISAAPPISGFEAETRILIYPNPVNFGADNTAKFENLTVNSELSIYNITGELIRNTTLTNTVFEWNGRDNSGNKVKNGIYLLVDKGTGIRKGKLAVVN